MQDEFDMSMMGELKYFLRLQIWKTKEGIFVNQSKYTKELLAQYELKEGKDKKVPMSQTTKLDQDENGKDVDKKIYRGMI